MILLWDVFDEKCKNVHAMKGHTNAILDTCWSSDSSHLYSCGADKLLFAWDVVEGTKVRKLKGHEGIVNSVAVVRRGPESVSLSSS